MGWLYLCDRELDLFFWWALPKSCLDEMHLRLALAGCTFGGTSGVR